MREIFRGTRHEWWEGFLADLHRFRKIAQEYFDEAERTDKEGTDDEAMRAKWYWAGYLGALQDIEEMRSKPVRPLFHVKGEIKVKP